MGTGNHYIQDRLKSFVISLRLSYGSLFLLNLLLTLIKN